MTTLAAFKQSAQNPIIRGLTAMLLTILVVIRDALLAAALAWVGVTVEQRANEAEQACSGASQMCERDR